jgi:predicted negative regulator of RcsB-dependent stress response
MPTQTQLENVDAAISNIRAAEQVLDGLIASTGDADRLEQLQSSYTVLNGMLTALLQAQTNLDDAAFEGATAKLKVTANQVKAQEALIQKAVADVALAAKVLGYVAQGVTFVMKL